uniref:Integrase catalytic domain-containing protein n=1 Tax=Fagus sylvatica TaxID=28930 RepID=A0A2N9HS45_FAGSY
MASKTVVVDLNRGEKLDGKNYDIWHRKIQYLLDELEVLETLTNSMEEPEQGNNAQNRRDLEAYQSWRKKDRCARFTMLSSMHNDLIGEFESYGTAQDMWIALKAKFGGTMHLRKMSAMVHELKAAGNNLTDEQQIQAVIRSLPDSWEQMKLNMTHNESIQTLEDLSRHLELEAERRVAQGQSSAFFARHGQRQASKAKRKNTGATDHVARDRVGFVEYCRVPAGNRWMRMGNESRVEVLGIGTYKLQLRHGRTLLLHDVLYAPRMRQNLLSVNVLLELDDRLFHLDIDCSAYDSSFALLTQNDYDEMNWHARLGHIGQDRMTRLAREGLLGPLAKVNLPTCEHCLAGKSTRKPFGKGVRATVPLELIHSDVCGPMNVRARHGASYFITFIDDFTCYGHVYLVSHKSEALDCFRRFMNLVENQMERTIKTLRTDRGREYLSEQFRELCENKGIRRQLTIPGTPQQNGVAERRNRTLLDMVRSMMAQANLPISFWGDALMAAAYILNRVPSKSVPSTPYELWSGKKPDLSNLRPWGIFKARPTLVPINVGQSLELYEMVESWDDTPATNPGDSGREITPSGSNPQLQEDDSQNPQLRRSQRGNVPRRRFGIDGESFISVAQDDTEPRSYDEAMSSPACNEWMITMKDEIESMRTNQVWELVDLPPGRRSIGNKWVLKIKRKADGSIDKFASIRLILAMVASLDLELHQMDVKTAFLNGELDEEIFMDQPIGFVVKGQERKEFIKTIKEWLSSTFEMKDMGEASFVLGVKILKNRSRKLLGLSQETYIRKVLKRFHMQDCKPIDTLVGKGDSLSSEMCPKTQAEIESMARVPYANAIGSLMYAMLCTRPDICFAVGLVSRFQSNPRPAYWKVMKRILRYLRGTADYMLCYQGRDLRLRGYSDADWAGDLDERKSTSGYTFLLGGGAITWCSKKQSCVALSTMESEYVACSAAVQEAVWLRRFLQRLDIVASAMDPVTIYSDSMAALAYAKDPKYHGKTKHIEIKYYYIRDMVAKKEVFLEHIPKTC